jgi:hypothetical protein
MTAITEAVSYMGSSKLYRCISSISCLPSKVLSTDGGAASLVAAWLQTCASFRRGSVFGRTATGKCPTTYLCLISLLAREAVCTLVIKDSLHTLGTTIMWQVSEKADKKRKAAAAKAARHNAQEQMSTSANTPPVDTASQSPSIFAYVHPTSLFSAYLMSNTCGGPCPLLTSCFRYSN